MKIVLLVSSSKTFAETKKENYMNNEKETQIISDLLDACDEIDEIVAENRELTYLLGQLVYQNHKLERKKELFKDEIEY